MPGLVRCAKRVEAIRRHMRRPSRPCEAVDAIAYATKLDWFWKGAQHIRKCRGTAH
jgi:hypothetical protein